MISFFVPGIPAPGGSKRFLGRSKKTGRGILVDSGKRNAPWRDSVACEAVRAMGSEPLLDGPLSVTMIFFLPRPKNHYRTGRNAGKLKPNAPPFPDRIPDALKLGRSTEDAMTGIVWTDDARGVDVTFRKRYADHPQKPGARILIQPLT